MSKNLSTTPETDKAIQTGNIANIHDIMRSIELRLREAEEKLQQPREVSTVAQAREGLLWMVYQQLLETNDQLRAKLEQAKADTKRLDYLQSTTKGYGNGWKLRESTNGRGMRLHETSWEGATPTVRLAIDAAMREDGK